MSDKPDAKWPDPEPDQKVEVISSNELKLYYVDPASGESTQSFAADLGVPTGHLLIVKIGDEIVYASPDAKVLGLEETVEKKEVK